MRNLLRSNSWAGGLVAVAVALTGLLAVDAAPARAESWNETMISGGFAKIGADTVRRAERSVDRRSAAARSSDDDSGSTRSRRSRGRQVASLGGGAEYAAPRPERSLSGGGNVRWVASASCLSGNLQSVVNTVAANYGSVTVSSTCRSHGQNARAGGAPKSYHLTGDAVDFRVSGNVAGAAAYLSSLGGGYKHMGGGLFHVDNGPRRPF